MRKMSQFAALTRALFGGIAGNRARRTYAHPGAQIWCRASVLLLLREREAGR